MRKQVETAEQIHAARNHGDVSHRTQQFRNPYHMDAQPNQHAAWNAGYEASRIRQAKEWGIAA